MKNVRTHNQAIDQIALELGLDRKEVAKICDMTFAQRGVIQKLKHPNVVELPKLGALVPKKSGVKKLQEHVQEIVRAKDREKQKRKYWRDKAKKEIAVEQQEIEEYIFENCYYLEKLISTNFTYHYHTWQMNLSPPQRHEK